MGTAEITNAGNNSVTVRAVSANPVRRIFDDGADGVWFEPDRSNARFQETTGASASTASAEGDPVGTLIDLSGNGRHATAPNDASRPTLDTFNGVQSMLGDGVDDHLVASFPPANSVARYLLALVYAQEGNGTNQYALQDAGGRNDNFKFGSEDGGVRLAFLGSDLTLNKARIFSAGWLMVEGYAKPSSFVRYDVDGANDIDESYSDGSGTDGAKHEVSMLAGADGVGPENVHCSAFLGFDRVPTDQERADIRTYLADRYGITL